MTRLCSEHQRCRQLFCHYKGVEELVSALRLSESRSCREASPDLLAHLRLVLDAVVREDEALEIFIRLDGIGLLLDVLSSTHRLHRPLLLTCVADLLSASQAVRKHLLSWTSKDGKLTVPALLLNLWRDTQMSCGPQCKVRIAV